MFDLRARGLGKKHFNAREIKEIKDRLYEEIEDQIDGEMVIQELAYSLAKRKANPVNWKTKFLTQKKKMQIDLDAQRPLYLWQNSRYNKCLKKEDKESLNHMIDALEEDIDTQE